MKNSLLISILLLVMSTMLMAEDWLTIYNDDLSLIRSTFNLNLKAGRQNYNFDQITSRIQPKSVIVSSPSPGFKVAEQNYEYDLADRWAVLSKYLDKEVVLVAEDNDRTTGILKYFDGSSYGVLEDSTQRFIMLSADKVQKIQLASLPENFYVRPTLHWSLISPKNGDIPVQLTYLSGGFSWDVVYNSVWDEKNLEFNSWVTINNQSGKSFEDANLKLIAGDINIVREYGKYYSRDMDMMYAESAAMGGYDAGPSFEEKSFHDFHMYSLDEKVSFANNQTKQITLYPTMNVKAENIYEYPLWGDGVKSIIKFKNTEANGIGVPLPKGNIKVYKQDTDGNLEFIGEDSIKHTGRNEEVSITTGKAFDLVGSTLVKDQSNPSRNVSERSIQVTLRNNSDAEQSINVVYQLGGNTKIIKTDITPEINTDNKATFNVKVPKNTVAIFTFRERTEY